MLTNFAPRCFWVDDRCQHGRRIDDRDTNWNAETRRFTCGARETSTT